MLRRFAKGDRKPGVDWYNAVYDRLDGPPLDVDASSGLTLTQLGTRFVLRFVMPVFVRPAVMGASGATARSGATLGEGTATLGTLGVASGAVVYQSIGREVEVYHLGSGAVSAGAYVLLLKVLGWWLVIWEDCPVA